MSFGLLATALATLGTAHAAEDATTLPLCSDVGKFVQSCYSDGDGMSEGIFLYADHGGTAYRYVFSTLDLAVTIEITGDSATGDVGHWYGDVFLYTTPEGDDIGLKFAVSGDRDDNPSMLITVENLAPLDPLDLWVTDLDGGDDYDIDELLTFRTEYLLEAGTYASSGGEVVLEYTNLLPAGPSGRFVPQVGIGNPSPLSPIAEPPEDTIKGAGFMKFFDPMLSEYGIDMRWSFRPSPDKFAMTSGVRQGGFFLLKEPVQGLDEECVTGFRPGLPTCDAR